MSATITARLRAGVEKRIREELLEYLVQPESRVSRFVEDMGFDESEFRTFLLILPTDLHIRQFSDSEIDQIHTFGDLVEAVCKRLK